MVVVIVVTVAEGRGGCRWVCGGGGCYLAGYVWLWLWLWLWPMVEGVVGGAVDFFFGRGIYYFTEMVILFYCDVYIILLY